MFTPKNDKKINKQKQPKVKPAPKQNRRSASQPDDDQFIIPGMTRGEFRKIIVDGRAQIKRIEDVGLKIMKHNVRVDILEICTTASDIFDGFVKDPKDIRVARRFTLYYLDTTERIVTKYYQLGKAPYLSEEAKNKKNVEQTLGMIGAFKAIEKLTKIARSTPSKGVANTITGRNITVICGLMCMNKEEAEMDHYYSDKTAGTTVDEMKMGRAKSKNSKVWKLRK